ncbi:ATP-binding cassette domain-containing protein [Pseudonocardia broussonetiae]|uniref:ATP-binding cassette domain-containing protein n=1 Tax=Pseudonocardia broussonetiae TaxID=2736640 RepID=A0A6M6JDR9_9PSEU|nr:ATP-binding cassette domain-containing protein [Pseudonocardia broussonetiae]QJY45185.1 ATP-binding cassette domain-containing protein [Pseudonocardia broussonetiae]
MRLEGVRKRYGRGPEVLAGVDLDVVPGVPAVVLGANGAGKSTLLRIAAGCSVPTSGRVRDRPRRVGHLPADLPVPERTPVRTWLAHLAAIRGSGRDGAEATALLERLGFTGGPDTPMGRLSTGNARKVGLAQALCGSPALLVLDEPWSGLDDSAAAALDAVLAGVAVPLLVADHSGRAGGLAGAARWSLSAGRLAPGPAPEAPRTVVVLRCPGDLAAVVARLPPSARCSGEGPVLTVRVPVAGGDALLAAALGAGCSVLSVRRPGTP